MTESSDTISHLEYELQNGFIHNWLVVGPLETAVGGAPDGDEHHRKSQIAKERENKVLAIQDHPSIEPILRSMVPN